MQRTPQVAHGGVRRAPRNRVRSSFSKHFRPPIASCGRLRVEQLGRHLVGRGPTVPEHLRRHCVRQGALGLRDLIVDRGPQQRMGEAKWPPGGEDRGGGWTIVADARRASRPGRAAALRCVRRECALREQLCEGCESGLAGLAPCSTAIPGLDATWSAAPYEALRGSWWRR